MPDTTEIVPRPASVAKGRRCAEGLIVKTMLAARRTPITVCLGHFAGSVNGINATNAGPDARTVDSISNERIVHNAKCGTKCAITVCFWYGFGHHHRRCDDHGRDRSVASLNDQAGANGERSIRSTCDCVANAVLDRFAKKVQVCSVDTSVHESGRVGRRDDSANGGFEQVAAGNVNVEIGERVEPRVDKRLIGVDEVEVHQCLGAANGFM